jgi:hypothetical protein
MREQKQFFYAFNLDDHDPHRLRVQRPRKTGPLDKCPCIAKISIRHAMGKRGWLPVAPQRQLGLSRKSTNVCARRPRQTLFFRARSSGLRLSHTTFDQPDSCVPTLGSPT